MSRTTTQIRDWLYLGGYHAPLPTGTTHVLGVGEFREDVPSGVHAMYVSNFEDDGTCDLRDFIDECVGFLDRVKRDGGKVYVHCMYGQSRSPAIVIGYLALLEQTSIAEAYRDIAQKREIAPDSRFVDQLLLWLDVHR